MTHIPSAASPREVTGGAQNTQASTTLFAGAEQSFRATLDASLLTTFAGATTDPKSPAPTAQSVRTAQTPAPIQGEAGVLRLATATELASAELATNTHAPTAEPAAPVPQRQQAHGQRSEQSQPRAMATPPQHDGAAPAKSRTEQPAPTPTPARTAPPASHVAAHHAPPAAQAAPPHQDAAASNAAGVSRVQPVHTIRPVAARPVAVARPTGVTSQARQPAQIGKPAHAPRSPHVLRNAKALQAQLVQGLAAAMKRAGNTITLNLRPRSLGRLTIELSVRDGGVDARIRATTEAARGLLESGGVELRESLASRGLTLHRLDVQVVEPEDRGVDDKHPDTPRDGEARARQDRPATPASRPDPDDERAENDTDHDEPEPTVVALGVDVTV